MQRIHIHTLQDTSRPHGTAEALITTLPILSTFWVSLRMKVTYTYVYRSD